MPDFFDPNSHSSALFAMGGTGHLVLGAILAGLLSLLICFRKSLRVLRQSSAFMAGTAAFILSLELVAAVSKFIYPCASAFERLPLHLCATLKIAIATLILFKRYDLVKYVAITAIGCGFISFANLNLGGGGFENFAFWHYLVGHFYLFAIPVLLFMTGELRYELKHHTRAMLGLAAWSLLIFFVNWVFDTNYMYSGPHNETVVAFVPAEWMAWPFNYVSYCLVGLVLLNGIYAISRVFQGRMDAIATRGALVPQTA